MTDDDNGKKGREKTDDVADVLGRHGLEMKMEQKWDSKGLRGLRSLSSLCWDSNRTAFILVSTLIQYAEYGDYDASCWPHILNLYASPPSPSTPAAPSQLALHSILKEQGPWPWSWIPNSLSFFLTARTLPTLFCFCQT